MMGIALNDMMLIILAQVLAHLRQIASANQAAGVNIGADSVYYMCAIN